MHADQLEIDDARVRRLVETQLPQWAGLALERIASDGTDHAIYRLGDDLAVRLPHRAATTAQVEKEHRWLPALAPRLPLPVPVPIALGEPGEGYPCRWSVCRWLPGEPVRPDRLGDPSRAARDLAGFVRALRSSDPTGGPAPGAHNFQRGVPLAARDRDTRNAIEALAGDVDVRAVTAAWERALEAPAWTAAPVWIHGDLAPGNLLVREGRLAGVLDWGGLGVGDPATDLLPAWNLFRDDARRVYREAMGADEATWARGRGLALSVALVALPYYRDSNPAIVRWARAMIDAVLADRGDG
jgi:aminoglycoside phosphotransferase (APT) family kinase protein